MYVAQTVGKGYGEGDSARLVFSNSFLTLFNKKRWKGDGHGGIVCSTLERTDDRMRKVSHLK
jgi:hypothetical protein